MIDTDSLMAAEHALRVEFDRQQAEDISKPFDFEKLAAAALRASTDAAPVAVKTDWVDCPLCEGTDMRRETDAEGHSLIFCVNYSCPSNNASAHPPVPDAAGADIVLVSQDRCGSGGYQLHGLFHSFADAARHVAKDAGLNSEQEAALIEGWSKPGDRHESAERREWWVASRQPVRAALAQPPAAEPVGMREALENMKLPVVGTLFVGRGAATARAVPGLENGPDEHSNLVRISDVAEAIRQALATGNGGETIESIIAWGDEVFGPVDPARAIERAGEEWAEMIDQQPGSMEHAIEAADVIIVLMRLPLIREAINTKMAKNRARKWKLMGDGTGYHIKDTGNGGEGRS